MWASDFVFNVLCSHRLELEVYSYNAPALKCYEKVGFVREGVSRQALWNDGAWHDVVQMGMLEEEWRAKMKTRTRAATKS